MKNKFRYNTVALVIMGGLALTGILKIGLAGIGVYIGLIFFILNRNEPRTIITKYQNRKLNKKVLLLLIITPIFIDIISILIAHFFLPEYITHVFARVGNILMLEKDKLMFLIIQIIIASILEEIGWRGFFQKEIVRKIPILSALLLTSFLFSIGHISTGNVVVIIYDILFVFLNSICYGIIYFKTENVWFSSLSHVLSNLFGVFIFMLL